MTKRKVDPDDIEAVLRAAVERKLKDATPYRVAKDAGLPQITIDRWLGGERDLRLKTATKIARSLGLRLVREKTAE